MKNQHRRTIGAYLLAAVVPLGAYAEQEDYFNQSAHGSEEPYRLFCANRPLIFPIPIRGWAMVTVRSLVILPSRSDAIEEPLSPLHLDL